MASQGTIRIDRKDAWKYQLVSHRTDNGVDIHEATVFYDDNGDIKITSYTSAYQKELGAATAPTQSASKKEKPKKVKAPKPKKVWKNKYWQWCRENLEDAFWICSPILFIVWLPFWILKWIFIGLWKLIKKILGALTFGLLDNYLNG